MIKFRLMTLNFSKISEIKVARVFKLVVLENNYSASLITNCQILTWFIVTNCCQNIILRNTFLVAFSQTIDVNPVQTVCNTIWIDLRLSRLLYLQILWRHYYIMIFILWFCTIFGAIYLLNGINVNSTWCRYNVARWNYSISPRDKKSSWDRYGACLVWK